MKATQLKSFLTASLTAKLPVLIKGACGIGKTEIVKSACRETGHDLIISHPVVSDPTDFKGLPFMDNDGRASFKPFGELTKLIEASEPTVFFLDDLGQAPASVQAAAMQLILGRRVNGHKVSDNVTFLAATNRRQDKAGVQGILEPVKSRFATIVELHVDADDWCSWASQSNIATELIAFIRFRPELLHAFEPTKDITNSPCPRTWAFVSELMKISIPEDAEHDIFAGAVGEAAASEFRAFIKVFKNLPDPMAIIENPHSGEVPTDPATLYALTGALAHYSTESNFDAVMTYCERLPAEFQVVLVKDATNRNPSLQKTQPFTTWAIENSNVIL